MAFVFVNAGDFEDDVDPVDVLELASDLVKDTDEDDVFVFFREEVVHGELDDDLVKNDDLVEVLEDVELLLFDGDDVIVDVSFEVPVYFGQDVGVFDTVAVLVVILVLIIVREAIFV